MSDEPRFAVHPYKEGANRFARFMLVDRRSGETVGYFRHFHDAQIELDRRNASAAMTWGDYISWKARAEAAEAALQETTRKTQRLLETLRLALSALHRLEAQLDYAVAQLHVPDQEAKPGDPED